MNNKIYVLIVFLVLILLAMLYVVMRQPKAHAWDNATITPIEDNDCLSPGQIDLDHSHDDILCISPTPLATPSASPSSTPTTNNNSGSGNIPQGNNSSTNPPGVCSDPKPSDVANFIVVPDKDGLKLEWAIVLNADHVDIRYGLEDGKWIYGAINLDNSGNYVVKGLQPNTPYFFQIAGGRGCSIGKWSPTVDPEWN